MEKTLAQIAQEAAEKIRGLILWGLIPEHTERYLFVAEREIEAACREAVDQFAAALTKTMDELPSIQVGSPRPGFFDATPLVRRQDVLALIDAERQRS